MVVSQTAARFDAQMTLILVGALLLDLNSKAAVFLNLLCVP